MQKSLFLEALEIVTSHWGRWVSEEDVTISKQTFGLVLYPLRRLRGLQFCNMVIGHALGSVQVSHQQKYPWNLPAEISYKKPPFFRNMSLFLHGGYRVSRKKVYQFSDFFEKNKGYFLVKLWISNERLLYFWWIAVRK